MEEIWKDVIGYEGYYQVSNLGNVRSVDRYVKGNGLTAEKQLKKGKMLKQFLKQGAWSVTLRKEGTYKFRYTYRLVAEAFIPNDENMKEVNHIDENKSNNMATNLEWCDRTHNCNHGTRNERISKSHGVPVMVGKTTFPSYASAAKFLGVATESIRCAVINGYKCRGYIVRKVATP